MPNDSAGSGGPKPVDRRNFDQLMLKWLSMAPRVFIAVFAVVLILGTIKLFGGDVVGFFVHGGTATIFSQIATLLTLVTLAGLVFSAVLEGGLLSTLRGWFTGKVLSRSHARETLELHKTIADYREQIDQLRAAQQSLLTVQDKEAILESLRSSVHSDAATEVLAEIRRSISSADVLEIVGTSSRDTLERLKLERSSIARRGNFNLFVGLLTTVAGIWLLLSYAHDLSMGLDARTSELSRQSSSSSQNALRPIVPRVATSAGSGDISAYIIPFLPRLSLVLLIEVFAYFFLGLYKVSLFDVKYIQNEITVVEFRVLALKAAIVTSDQLSLREILRAYVAGDRRLHSDPNEGGSISAADVAKLLDSVRQLLNGRSKR
ncbi:MAG TPA: hypothetical protein VGQ46_17960 [Thermoanaerobaculia bacterium]|nr:hypothetical protein [Thermoanaerobaculia bacterium]